MKLTAQSEKYASSRDVGKLGVRHLKRYWAKRMLEVEGKLDRDVVRGEHGLDFTLMHGLGVGITNPLEYIFRKRPSFDAFENWIIHKLGSAPEKDLVDRLNEMVERYLDGPHRDYPLEEQIEDPVLSSEDMEFWHENGYLVVKNAASIDDCRAAEAAIFEYLGMNPQNPDSWYGSDHMFWVDLFRHPALERNRSAPRIRKAFEQVWGATGLWTTVDRSSLNRPQRGMVDISGPSRLHWDVSLAMPMPFGVQGILYLGDASAEQGAFRCIPGFHRRLERWLDTLEPGMKPRDQDLESLGPVPVEGNAGDFVIWNHALPHGSGRNFANYPRVVQYITMFPHDHGINHVWK